MHLLYVNYLIWIKRTCYRLGIWDRLLVVTKLESMELSLNTQDWWRFPFSKSPFPYLFFQSHLGKISLPSREIVLCSVASVMSNSLQPMDYSPPGSSAHGILHARILEWVVMPSFSGPSRPRNRTHISSISCTAGRFYTHWATWEAQWKNYIPTTCTS